MQYYSVYNDLNIGGKAKKRNISNHYQVLKNIANHRLWNDIKDLLEILKKLYKYQVISESSHIHLGLIL